MIKNDKIINTLMYGDAVQKLAERYDISIPEARTFLSQMSFSEYRLLDEASADIVPPSGKKISGGNPPGQQSQPAQTSPSPTTEPTTAQVGQNVDPRGVQVKNPVTGKMEWMMPSSAKPGQAPAPGPAVAGQTVAEDADIKRMRQLAGIKEDASCGATGAGAIAMAPTSVGGIKKRQPTNEQQPKEYTPDGVPKTIVGDTKPSQASGELSANLAAKGKRTATRTNNGLRR